MNDSRKWILIALVSIQSVLGVALLLLGDSLRSQLSKGMGEPADAVTSSMIAAGDLLYSSADAMSGLGKSAQSAATSFQAYQDATVGLRQTINDLFALVGAYQQNLLDAAATANDVVSLSQKVSSGLRFKVPTGVHLEKFLPVIEWNVPSTLSSAASDVDEIGGRARATAESLRKTAQVLGSQGDNQAKVNAAFDKTVQTLQDAQKAANQFDDEKLRLATDNLRRAGEKLKTTGTNSKGPQETVGTVATLVTILGLAAVVNAFIPLMLGVGMKPAGAASGVEK